MGNGVVKFPPVGQVGVVVRDLEKAIKYYSSVFGLGPWKIIDLELPETEVRGKIGPWKAKIAIADWGSVEFELVQPVEGRSIHAEFLEKRGEGLHHLGFFLNSKEEKDQIMTEMTKAGVGVLQGGGLRHHSGSYAYLDTEKIGGVILELVHRPGGRAAYSARK